jgi:transcriptional regulator with XRE-family HTH domain/cytoskeletal protein CcmA (bactofilin family)
MVVKEVLYMNDKTILGTNIVRLRKEKELTQGDLADLLFVSHQAVSQWERSETYPDVFLLPELAKVFGVAIDELFGGEGSKSGIEPKPDDKLRMVLFIGDKIIKSRDVASRAVSENKISFEYTGEALAVECWSDMILNGNVKGSINAGDDITVLGSVDGSINCGDGANISKDVNGSVNAGDSVTCEGNIGGPVNAGDAIRCSGSIQGNVSAGDNINCGGNIHGNVRCQGSIRIEGRIITDEE